MSGHPDWNTDAGAHMELLTLPASTLDRVSQPAVRDAIQYFSPDLVTIPGARTPTARDVAPDFPVLHPQLGHSKAKEIVIEIKKVGARGQVRWGSIDETARQDSRCPAGEFVFIRFGQPRIGVPLERQSLT